MSRIHTAASDQIAANREGAEVAFHQSSARPDRTPSYDVLANGKAREISRDENRTAKNAARDFDRTGVTGWDGRRSGRHITNRDFAGGSSRSSGEVPADLDRSQITIRPYRSGIGPTTA